MADRDRTLPVSALDVPPAELTLDCSEAAVAHFSSRAAHDLNNVWMGIGTYGEVLRRRLADLPEVASAVEQLLESVSRGKGLTDEMQQISRPLELRLRSADVRLFAASHGDDWASIAPDRSISLMTENSRLDARIDPAHLASAVAALVRNAVEASSDPDPVLIDVRRAGEAVEIAVLDHGPGVPEADVMRLFEPRFTTKPRHRGTGLYFARRIVRAHGGWIEFRAMERGTEAVIVLPAE